MLVVGVGDDLLHQEHGSDVRHDLGSTLELEHVMSCSTAQMVPKSFEVFKVALLDGGDGVQTFHLGDGESCLERALEVVQVTLLSHPDSLGQEGVVLSLLLRCSSPNPKTEQQHGLVRDVGFGEGAAILQLHALVEQSLMLDGDDLLVLDNLLQGGDGLDASAPSSQLLELVSKDSMGALIY